MLNLWIECPDCGHEDEVEAEVIGSVVITTCPSCGLDEQFEASYA